MHQMQESQFACHLLPRSFKVCFNLDLTLTDLSDEKSDTNGLRLIDRTTQTRERSGEKTCRKLKPTYKNSVSGLGHMRLMINGLRRTPAFQEYMCNMCSFFLVLVLRSPYIKNSAYNAHN